MNRQYGLSMTGFLMFAVVMILLAIGAMKIIPVYIQDKTIKTQFEEVARDPEMKDATVQTVRMAYAKRAMVADITNIKAEDVAISKDGGVLTLSAEYTVKVPLASNVSLLFEFKTSSAQ